MISMNVYIMRRKGKNDSRSFNCYGGYINTFYCRGFSSKKWRKRKGTQDHSNDTTLILSANYYYRRHDVISDCFSNFIYPKGFIRISHNWYDRNGFNTFYQRKTDWDVLGNSHYLTYYYNLFRIFTTNVV